MPPKRFVASSTAAFGLCLSGNVKLHKSDALRRYVRKDLAHLFKISSAGRDDAVARAQRRVGDSCSYAATGTRDEPNLAHTICPVN